MDRIAKALGSHDKAYQEVAQILFGDGADELIAKMNPAQSDLSAEAKQRKFQRRQAQVGLASNAIGITAGTAATAESMKKLRQARAKGGKVKALRGKLVVPATLAAGAGLGLQATNLGGDVIANRVLARSAKKKPETVKKDGSYIELAPTKRNLVRQGARKGAPQLKKLVADSKRHPQKQTQNQANVSVSTDSNVSKGTIGSLRRTIKNAEFASQNLARASVHAPATAKNAKKISRRASIATGTGGAVVGGGLLGGGYYAGQRNGSLRPTTAARSKRKEIASKSAEDADIVWEGEISKMDTDKRQVFGWASVVEVNGQPVHDLQGDIISADEIEKAAYDYVQKSRKGGDNHRRIGEAPYHASDMIESMMFTPEKVEKMGLPPGSVPTGWWVGYQVHDDDLWAEVKKGKRTGFSIHGRGRRRDA